MSTAGHYVYRLYAADGSLLYVGLTSDLERRRRQHTETAPWWSAVASWRIVGPFANRLSAAAVERRALLAERPLWNRHGFGRAVRAGWSREDYQRYLTAWSASPTRSAWVRAHLLTVLNELRASAYRQGAA